MKPKRMLSHLLLLAPLLLLGVAALQGCGDRRKNEPEETAAPDSIIHLPSSALADGEVRIAAVSAQPLADTVVVNGQVQAKPLNLAHVSARASGTIE